MLDVVLSGLVAGLTYAVLAAGLVLVQAAWCGLRPIDGSSRLGDVERVAALVLGLLPAWAARALLEAVGPADPALSTIAWPFLPALLALLALVWLYSATGRIWRAQIESGALAHQLGLPAGRASAVALALAALLGACAGILAAGSIGPTQPPPELRALAAVLAAGGGNLLLAMLLALAAGLAEGAAALLVEARLAELAGLALLLLVMLRPRRTPHRAAAW